MKIIYYCDPEKNKECRKNNCHYDMNNGFGRCKMTIHEEYAVRDRDGKPVVAQIRDDGKEGDTWTAEQTSGTK